MNISLNTDYLKSISCCIYALSRLIIPDKEELYATSKFYLK